MVGNERHADIFTKVAEQLALYNLVGKETKLSINTKKRNLTSYFSKRNRNNKATQKTSEL